MTSIEGARPRWYQRVLPVTALAVALLALATLAVPGFRDQVRLSASHQREPYVELYFARAADGTQLVCTSRVRFTIASHLDRASDLAYEVTVDGTTRTGTASVAPGESVDVDEAVAHRGAYDVAVLLPASGDRLRAHCPGGRR